jgi:hypothetical protein
MNNWLKKHLTNIAIAIGNVEKNTLSQENIDGGIETSKHQRLNQNSVMDALLRGEITEEVEKLRWRIYKTMSSMKNYGSKIIGYTDDGYPIMETFYVGDEEKLSKIKLEPTDDYQLIMVVDNTNVSAGIHSALSLDIDVYDEVKESEDCNVFDETISTLDDSVNTDSDINFELNKTKTIGELKNNNIGLNLPLTIGRDHIPKFKLENYTKKLHVKKINHNEFLLEFFISKYPEQFDKKHHFFLSDIKKIIDNPTRYNSTIDFNTVSFVTNNTVGVPDFLEFEYNINKFDKIVEFNEFYVIKFISEVTTEARSIIDQFKNVELDEKYNNKEKR